MLRPFLPYQAARLSDMSKIFQECACAKECCTSGEKAKKAAVHREDIKEEQ